MRVDSGLTLIAAKDSQRSSVVHHSKIGLPMSALGHKQTKPPAWTLSALPPKADKHWHRSATPLRAKSGRMHRSKNTLRRDAVNRLCLIQIDDLDPIAIGVVKIGV